MHIRKQDRNGLSLVVKFVKSLSRTVPAKQKVFSALRDATGYSSSVALDRLRWGNRPTLIPAEFKCKRNPETGNYGTDVGMTWSKEKFGVSRAVLDRYEHAATLAVHDPKGAAKDVTGWAQYLEAIILHELVHISHIERNTNKPFKVEEQLAQAFETAAYGHVVKSPDPLCFQPQTYTPAATE